VASGEFLVALLTGAGDVDRYVSPGTAIAPVTPPPYSAVDVTDVTTDRDVLQMPVPPATGETVRVLVTARATAGPRQQIGVQYALTLIARAGRWEVRVIDLTPVLGRAGYTTSPAGAGLSGVSPSASGTRPTG
jgi:hypothetical protein